MRVRYTPTSQTGCFGMFFGVLVLLAVNLGFLALTVWVIVKVALAAGL